MRIAIISFTQRGAHLAHCLAQGLSMCSHTCTAYAMPRHAKTTGVFALTKSLAAWTTDAFAQADALIFVSACGVAVRAVAPLLRSKTDDPAVVVIDDNASFAISLLSGHIGGANKLTHEVAHLTGAQAVVSTATDGNGVFAVDTWATRENCAIWELSAAKAVSAALLDGETIGLCSDFLVEPELPYGIQMQNSGKLGICVTLDEHKSPFGTTLHIVPRVLTLGIGCKRGTKKDAIESKVVETLSAHHISQRAVCGVATINIKAQEHGLLAYCNSIGVSLCDYAAEELAAVQGVFTASEFVRGVTGTDNVCERAAVLNAGENSTLMIKKQAGNGVTVAAAMRDWRVQF